MNWPFDQDPATATLTTKQVVEDGFPILQVVHYSDDHSWGFTCGTSNEVDDGRIVCMSHLVELDPTIISIADLEPGWVAYREAVGERWERYFDEQM